MNILFYLFRYPGYGGIEKVTKLISEELSQAYGISITILSFVQQESFPVMNGIILKKMPNSQKWLSSENYAYAENVIKNGNFDCIVYQDSYAETEKIICGFASKYKIKLFTFEHSTPLIAFKSRINKPFLSYEGLKQRFFKMYSIIKSVKRKRYLLRHSDKYVLLSEQYIPEFAKSVLISPNNKKLTFINNPIEVVSGFVECKKENVILCVCQLFYGKSVNLMIDLWSKLCTLLPDWKFVIVGDGKDRFSFEMQVRELNVPRVEFIGFANPTEYYKKAKIFWMMSRFEGSPMTLGETLQFGCIPIVYNSFSSLCDIIDDSKNGFIVKDLDENTFMQKTLFLAYNEEKRLEMAEYAKESIKRFDVKNVAKKWINELFYL